MYVHANCAKVDQERIQSSQKLGLLIKWSLVYKLEKNQNSNKTEI